ncbi:MAG: hypothetical protein QNK37_01875 [Acidobacteriota bacterium]|nr:hypothetical protein [Acidobacteriota bacterium]
MPVTRKHQPNLRRNGPLVSIHIGLDEFAQRLRTTMGEELPEKIAIQAMVDTGAATTLIDPTALDRLAPAQIDQVQIQTPGSTGIMCSRYWLRLHLPDQISMEMPVIGAGLEGQHIQCLLGRDVLMHAVLVYDGPKECFSLSFD